VLNITNTSAAVKKERQFTWIISAIGLQQIYLSESLWVLSKRDFKIIKNNFWIKDNFAFESSESVMELNFTHTHTCAHSQKIKLTAATNSSLLMEKDYATLNCYQFGLRLIKHGALLCKMSRLLLLLLLFITCICKLVVLLSIQLKRAGSTINLIYELGNETQILSHYVSKQI
jgi:hypothetical protein